MNYTRQIEWLKERLQNPLPGSAGQERMAARVRPMPDAIPEDARPSAVISLLFPHEEQLKMLLIQRTIDGRAHSGQISFPGGKQDPSDADLRATALREMEEEVGIGSINIDIIGALTPLYIPVSNFRVYPFVAFSAEKQTYNINRAEVAQVLEIPLQDILHPDRKTLTDVVSPAMPGTIRNVKAYKLSNDIIVWGATAMIISELETVLEEYKEN